MFSAGDRHALKQEGARNGVGKWRAAGGQWMNTSNNPVGLGNQPPWRGEPWDNHGDPGHGKSGKYPGHQDGPGACAGVRVDPEAPRPMARVRVGLRVSGTGRMWKRLFPGLQPRMDDNQVHPGAEWVLQPVWLMEIDGYPHETRLQAPERLCLGGWARGILQRELP